MRSRPASTCSRPQQVKHLAGRVAPRAQLALGFAHTIAMVTMLDALGSGSWPRLLPGLIVGGIGSGLLNGALPLLAVESVPPQRAAMRSGAQQTFRYIGSRAGVALTIAVATSPTARPGARTSRCWCRRGRRWRAR